MVRRDLVKTTAELGELIENQLTWTVLPSDGVALLNAHRLAQVEEDNLDEIARIDWRLHAMKLPRELRVASALIGRRLLAETAGFGGGRRRVAYAARVGSGSAPGLSPIALALVAVDLDISEEIAFGTLAHSYVVSVLGAALRLLPVSHRDCQAILHTVQRRIAGLFEQLANRHWHDMSAFSPELDLAAIGHAADDVRMFAS
jgi:urease accessory protein